jgi:glycosyltransferase involved in cell wall biosynthesis
LRILIISQFYGSDPEGFFVEDLADHWAGGGHEVLVVTGGVSRDAAASRARVVGGVGRGYDRASLASRFVSISAFAAAAAWAASRESAKRRADVLVSVGTRVPVLPRPRAVIRWTLDRRLQVLAAIATPESIRRTLLHVASVAERLVGELAPSVEVAISAEMAATASRRGRRVEHIPLWAPQNVTHRRDRSSERRRREGLAEGQFLLRYQGNLGRAYDFATLLDAARQLRGTAVRVVVAGRGSERAFLERSLATDAELRSVVSLLDAVAPDELPHALAAADAHLVPLRPGTGGHRDRRRRR